MHLNIKTWFLYWTLCLSTLRRLIKDWNYNSLKILSQLQLTPIHWTDHNLGAAARLEPGEDPITLFVEG